MSPFSHKVFDEAEAKLSRRRREGEVGEAKWARRSGRGDVGEAKLERRIRRAKSGESKQARRSKRVEAGEAQAPFRLQTSKVNARASIPDWLKIKLVAKKKLVLQTSCSNHTNHTAGPVCRVVWVELVRRSIKNNSRQIFF